MGWGDTWEFLHAVWDDKYVPEVYRKPIPAAEPGATKEQRQAQLKAISDEANQKTESYKEIALNTETVLATAIELPEDIVDPYLSLPFGTITEDVADKVLAKRGEAPLASWRKRWLPTWLGGNEYYQNGGKPWDMDNPDRPKTGTGEKGIVWPWEQATAAWDVGVDYKNAIVSLPEIVSNLVNPKPEDDSELEKQVDEMCKALEAQHSGDPNVNPEAAVPVSNNPVSAAPVAVMPMETPSGLPVLPIEKTNEKDKGR